MGQIVFQPSSADPHLLAETSLAVFPTEIERKNLHAVVEWAAATQIPIFCRALDIPSLEKEGFGAYRFLKLEGYREVDFQGGTIEFFPARRRQAKNFSGYLRSVGEFFGWSPKPQGFHVRLRPKNEHPILVLASAEIDSVEWTLLTRENPSQIVAMETDVTTEDRLALETRFGAKILLSTAAGHIQTQPLTSVETSPKKHMGLWAVNSH